MKTKSKDAKMMAAVGEIAPNPNQPRTFFAEEDLQRLGASLARRQQQPVTVVPFKDEKRPAVRWMIVDGERRWRAAKAAGMKRLWIALDEAMSSAELHTASFTANWNRAGHTHEETARAIDREIKAGRTLEEVAALVGKSESWAGFEHSLLKLQPDLLRLCDPPTPKEKRIPIRVAYALARVPEERQARMWEKFKNKKGESALLHHIRVAAPSKRERRSGDDTRYVLGMARRCGGLARSIAALPAAMLRTISEEKRTEIAAALQAAARQAEQTAAMFQATADAGDDDE